MNQLHYSDILKYSCVEVYGVPANVSPDNLFECFKGRTQFVHFVKSLYDQRSTKWLILLHNPDGR